MALTNPFSKYKQEAPQPAATVSDGNPFAKYAQRSAGMAAPVDNLAVDDERVQMAQAQMRAERSGAPVGEPGFLGGAKELGKGLARGAAVTLPEMAGKALDWFDPEGGSDAVAERGRQMQDSAAQRLKDNTWLQESELSRVKKEDDAFSLRGGVAEGGEMLAPSMGLPLAGAATGLALGGPPGAAIGAAAGFIGSLPLYFGAQAQDTYERVKPEQLKAAKQRGLQGEQADEYAHDEAWKAGMLTGGIEAGGEALADRVTFGLFRLLPRGVKQGLVRSATKAVRGPGELVKDFAKIVATETGTELAQGAGQQEVEQAYGVGEGASWDNVKGVIIPTMVMSALTFGAGETVGTLNRRAVNKALSDPATDPQKRAQAVMAVEREVRAQDEELADLWVEYAGAQVAKGQPVALNQDDYYRELGVEPDAPEEEVAAAVKAKLEGTEMPARPIEGQLLPAGDLTGAAPQGPLSRAVHSAPQPSAPSAPIIPSPTLDRPAEKSIRQKEQESADAKAKSLDAQRKAIEDVATGQSTAKPDQISSSPNTTTPTTRATEPAMELGATDAAPVETAEQKRQRLIEAKKKRPPPGSAPIEDAAGEAAAISLAQSEPQKVNTEPQGVVIEDDEQGAVADDPRLKRDPYRAELERMAGDLTVNGGMSIVPRDGAKPTSNTGDVLYDYDSQDVIRTPSLNPEWFKRWDSEVGSKPTVKEIKEAVRRALAGEKLGKRQARIVRGMLDNVQGGREEPPAIGAAQAERADRAQRRKAGFGGKPYQPSEAPAPEAPDPGRRELEAAIAEARSLVGDDAIEDLVERGAAAGETNADLAEFIRHEARREREKLPPSVRKDYDPMTDELAGEKRQEKPAETPAPRRPVNERRTIDLGNGNSQILEPLTEASFAEWIGPASQYDSFEEFTASPEGRDAEVLNILRTPDGVLLGEPRFGKADDLDMSATRRQAGEGAAPISATDLANLARQLKGESDRLRDQVRAKVEAGEFVLLTGSQGDTAIGITPSAQQPGQYQVTRYNRSGIIGDSQYTSIDQLLSMEVNSTLRMTSSEEAEAAMRRFTAAETEYQSTQRRPDLTLEQQAPEDLARLEAEDKARTETERQAQQKVEADAQVDDFVLAGSDREIDQREARGQANLFDQPAEPKPYRIEAGASSFQPEQLDGVTLEVEYEDDNGVHRLEVKADMLLAAGQRRMEILNRLGECLSR